MNKTTETSKEITYIDTSMKPIEMEYNTSIGTKGCWLIKTDICPTD